MIDCAADAPTEIASILSALHPSHPGLNDQIRDLAAMAKALKCLVSAAAVRAHQNVEVLLSKTWSNPREVLDLSAVDYRELLAVARARSQAANGRQKEKLLEIQRRSRKPCPASIRVSHPKDLDQHLRLGALLARWSC